MRTKALDERPEPAGSRATQGSANALAVDFFVIRKDGEAETVICPRNESYVGVDRAARDRSDS